MDASISEQNDEDAKIDLNKNDLGEGSSQTEDKVTEETGEATADNAEVQSAAEEPSQSANHTSSADESKISPADDQEKEPDWTEEEKKAFISSLKPYTPPLDSLNRKPVILTEVAAAGDTVMFKEYSEGQPSGENKSS